MPGNICRNTKIQTVITKFRSIYRQTEWRFNELSFTVVKILTYNTITTLLIINIYNEYIFSGNILK